MKASELIACLAECIKNHGDCEVTAYDGCDPSDLCHADGVSVDDMQGDKKFFQVYGSRFFERFPPKRVATYLDGEKITEQVAKVLAANSPFIACLEKRPFIKPEEIRKLNENQ